MKNMLNISINLGDIYKEMMLSKRDIEAMTKTVLMDATVAIANSWKQSARRELHSTRQGYLRGIYVVESGRLTNAIVLGGSLNNMIESGASSFDMKEGFKKSSKVKFNKKGGWYLRIPFRFAAAGSLGENEAFSGGVLPKEIQSVINSSRSSNTGRFKKSGGTLKAIDIPSPYDIPKSRAAFSDVTSKRSFDEYKHKASIYEGIGKSTKFYEEKSGSQFNSFRTVGENSDKGAFLHPGFAARNFAEKGIASTNLDILIENSVDKFLSKS